jgi:hypothetical protein
MLTPLNRTWTGRTISLPSTNNGERLVLHLGAVDYTATVYVDGEEVGAHEGGFAPFSIDITRFAGAERMVVIRADDPLSDASTPRGKQDIKPVPSDIYYNSTTGIWRSVTLELVPAVSIVGVSWAAVTEDALDLKVTVSGDVCSALFIELDLSLQEGGSPVGPTIQPSTLAINRTPSVTVSVSVPDALKRMITWTPDRPTVVDARVRLVDTNGLTLDEVATYTALLQWSIVPNPRGDRRMGLIALHGSPLKLRGVMNQGYDPQSGLTPNRDELRRTYQLMRQCGLNFARIHQTVPSEEECEIALRCGILLGLEPPSPRETSHKSMRRTAACWSEIAENLSHCPAIALVFVTNETWGVEAKTVPGFSTAQSEEDRDRILSEEFPEGFTLAVDKQYDTLIKTTLAYFSNRLISASDGWLFRPDRVPMPVLGQHDYRTAAVLRDRYASGRLIDRLLEGVEPGRRLLPPDFDETFIPRTAVILSEMGGRTVAIGEREGDFIERDPLYLPDDPTAPATWAYSAMLSRDEYASEVRELFNVACSSELSGGVLTQWRDVVIYWKSPEGNLCRGGEHNGLVDADGQLKVSSIGLQQVRDHVKLIEENA